LCLFYLSINKVIFGGFSQYWYQSQGHEFDS